MFFLILDLTTHRKNITFEERRERKQKQQNCNVQSKQKDKARYQACPWRWKASALEPNFTQVIPSNPQKRTPIPSQNRVKNRSKFNWIWNPIKPFANTVPHRPTRPQIHPPQNWFTMQLLSIPFFQIHSLYQNSQQNNKPKDLNPPHLKNPRTTPLRLHPLPKK